MNIPFATNDLGAVTDDDRKVVDRFVEEGVDIVALSVKDGRELRDLGLEPHPRGPMLIAKIESADAVTELSSIIEEASAILVARGGLGMQTPLAELPHLQKRIIRDCIAGGLPVITAGQMLDSMVKVPTPTRAEATDVANAVFDGTSGVMLSAETAIGAYPVGSVAMMARIAETADDAFDHQEWALQVAELRMAGHDDDDATMITDAITIAAAQAAESVNVRSDPVFVGVGVHGSVDGAVPPERNDPRLQHQRADRSPARFQLGCRADAAGHGEPRLRRAGARRREPREARGSSRSGRPHRCRRRHLTRRPSDRHVPPAPRHLNVGCRDRVRHTAVRSLMTSKPRPIATPMWVGSNVTKRIGSGKSLSRSEVDRVAESHRL